MTTQANPPTDAYAHGYVQNAQTHTRALTQRQTRLPASRTTHHESYHPNPQRTTKPLLPPPSPPAEATHEMFMQTVDYRYDDPPTRPFVPWRASLPSYEMQRFRTEVPVPTAPPSRAKRRRLDVRRYSIFARLSFRLLIGVSCSRCFGPCVVRVASPRVAPDLALDRFDS
jgi:hypothetical protein